MSTAPPSFLRRFLPTLLGVCMLALIVVFVNVLSSRHYRRADWTRGRVYALSPKAKLVLAGLKTPLRLQLLMADPGRGSESLYPELAELLDRFARASSRVKVERIDVDLSPARAEVIAKEHNVPRQELSEGVVVVAAGRRAKIVPARALGEYEVTRAGRRLIAFRGEAVLLSALIAVSRGDAPRICFSSGHGEADSASYAAAGYGALADEIRRDGFQVAVLTEKDLLRPDAGELARRCKVILIGGPSRAFAAIEVEALQRYLRGGGKLFLLLGPALDRGVTRYASLGLESLTARWGVALPKTIVVDPVGIPGEQPLMTWATRDGYGDHPVGRAMAGKLTVWPLARELRVVKTKVKGLSVAPLVRTSPRGWAESDLASLKGQRPLSYDPAVDRKGPVIVAAAVSHGPTPQMVVFGSERGLLNRRLAAPTLRDYNRDLFLAALAWLSDEMALVAIGPKRPEHQRLALDDKQLGKTFLIVVVVMPLMALCGGLVAWRRRRR